MRGLIEPKHLDSFTALLAAESTPMCQRKGERDTEFVKRIVCAYLNAMPASDALQAVVASYMGDRPSRETRS